MAFANLFARLPALEGDLKSSGQPAFAHRNETGNVKRGNARKRKTQDGQTGPHEKKQCYQDQTATPNGPKATHFRMLNTDSNHVSAGFSREGKHSHKDQAGHSNMQHKGQKCRTENKHNVNKQQDQRKKTKEQKTSHHQQRGRGRSASRGGGHQTRPNLRNRGGDRKNQNDAQDPQVKQRRSMTQEFMEQNVLSVDGRFICRHFLWGRCIKGDKCQLEHVQGHNDLIKESCKFYIQGFCTKGESCPYMHKSFPCKFFHNRGKCSQGANCRFSHDQLNDVTKRLLDEAIKQENELHELAKKAEQKSSGEPVTTDEPETMEAKTSSDTLTQPFRPSFYNDTGEKTENDDMLCPTEERGDSVEEAVPPHAPDDAQSPSTPSAKLSHEEPVCYSVEAVLGPQRYKPFTGFFTTPRGQEVAPLSSSNCTSDSANQSQVPYSVDVVLSTFKSVENSTYGNTTIPPTAQTVSYTPKTYHKEISYPFLSSETPKEKVSYSVNTTNEVNRRSQERVCKSLSSHPAHTAVILKTSPNDTLSFGDHKKQGLNTPNDIVCSVNRKDDGVLPFGPTSHKSILSPGQTSSEHPEQCSPHLSGLTSDSQASFKPLCPSSGFTEFKGCTAERITSCAESGDSADSVNPHFAAKQPPESHLHTKITQSGLRLGAKQQYLTETTAESGSGKAHCGDLAVGDKKFLKRPFHSLFASPITDTLQPVDDSVSSSCVQGLRQSSCPAPEAADRRRNHLKTKPEPDKASSRSFLSLFAVPLNAAPLPCELPPPDYSKTSQKSVPLDSNTSHLSDSKQGASHLETPLPRQLTTDVKETFPVPRVPSISPNPETDKDSTSVSMNQQLPDTSSHKGSARTTGGSVLKTLFLCLSPYQQDGEKQNVPG